MKKIFYTDNKIYLGEVDSNKFEKEEDITNDFIYILTNGFLPKDTERIITVGEKKFKVLNAEYSIEGYQKAIDTLSRELEEMKK